MHGAGRSVLADRYGLVVAGNKTVEQARKLGLPIQVVQTDGQTLVVVQRRDLDLQKDPAARALAVRDNRIGEIDLEWDGEVLKALSAQGVADDPVRPRGDLPVAPELPLVVEL